jgi:hypothetical protein
LGGRKCHCSVAIVDAESVGRPRASI